MVIFQCQKVLYPYIAWRRRATTPSQFLYAKGVVSFNPTHGEMYLIQHYVKKFVSDLQHVGDFLHIFNLKAHKNLCQCSILTSYYWIKALSKTEDVKYRNENLMHLICTFNVYYITVIQPAVYWSFVLYTTSLCPPPWIWNEILLFSTYFVTVRKMSTHIFVLYL
jgi:hypothetical protein